MNTALVDRKNWKVLIVFFVLLIVLILVIQLVQRNQENRSQAASEVSNKEINVCGRSDGQSVLSRPVSDLCSVGSAIWIDSVANNGLYKWQCVNEPEGQISECSAFLKE